MSDLSLYRFVALSLCLFLVPLAAPAQTPSPQSRIVESVKENVRVTLRGNTHPLAQPQFDQGAAPPDLPMARMLLVLKRSDAQELALGKLLDDQQDQNSPSYHQWLSPDEFGQQFGPSDQDIQAVSAWLRSHGFQIGAPSRGRTVIEFSGTASQVQQAFHTEIHKFTVNREDHWANASDPQIPQALSPVVVGVASLHNFPKQPLHRIIGRSSGDRATVRSSAPGAEFTTACPGGGTCYLVGPYDFATIYNVLPLWNASPAIDGTGQSIAIADISNINTQDVTDFRNLFGLPTTPFTNYLQIFLDGPDPGIVPGAETEALLDVEWAGAVAKGATIKLVVSAPTNSTEGADLASLYAIENNLAPIVSESFGDCELYIGTAGNSFENAIRQQASAQGITFLTSSGDQGSATCDGSGTLPAPATFGLAVSGLASSPYGVAVGGTDFLNFGTNYDFQSPSPYWNPTNNPTDEASARGYVPETTWNDSCTNNVFILFSHFGSTPEASCNNSQLPTAAVNTEGGGGGKSNCTSSTGPNPSNCTWHYAKPPWQVARGVPADGARDIPDVSLFAGVGFMASGYIFCETDQLPSPVRCSLNGGLNSTFLGIGGTSASAPAFAGIMALVNQYTGSAGQGNANYVLYKLASSSTQTSQNCGATSTPASGCIFYDVTSGTIAMPCAKNSPDCSFSNSADLYGVLSGYSATAGYDLATGLGSVNAYNLVHNWIGPTKSSTTTLSLTSQNGSSPISITHGQKVNFTIDITPSAATGAVSLVGLPGGSGTPSVPMASFPLQNGVASGTTASLAGGSSYSVRAHYSGDGTYQPSDSSAVTVTVAPEPSMTLITIPVFDPTTGVETGNMPTSIVYGTPAAVRVDEGNAQANQSFPPRLVCAPLACPTGNITLTDSLNGGAPSALSPAGGFVLSSGGYAEDDSVPLLTGGAHQFGATYPGDKSYQSSMGNYNLTVTPAPTGMPAPTVSCSPCVVGGPININVQLKAVSIFTGAVPTGTITFYDGTTPLSGAVTYFGMGGTSFSSTSAFLFGYITTTVATNGTHQISAKYSGDANYASASAPAMSVPVMYASSMVATAQPSTVNLGQSVNVTVTVTGASKTPPMTGTFQFSSMPNPVTPTQGTDSNGNQTLTATVAVTPQTSGAIYVYYPGDTNYAFTQTSADVVVNIPDFSLNLPSSPLLISAGQPGSVVVTVVPASNIASAVSLSCGGNAGGELPAGYTCALSPATVNLSDGASATSTFTLTPNVQSAAAFVSPAPNAKRSRLINDYPGFSNGVLLLSGLLAMTLLIWPIKWPNRRIRTGIFIFGVICFTVGCGGGGGGGPAPVPQPTTISVMASAAKIAYSAPLSFTATVNGFNHPTGSVLFYLNGIFSGSANLVGNTAVTSGQIPLIGIYVLTAQYTGDAANNPSTSTGVNLSVTGTSNIGIQGVTSTLNHFNEVTYTIQ